MDLSWETLFRNGVASFRVGKYQDSIEYFNKVISTIQNDRVYTYRHGPRHYATLVNDTRYTTRALLHLKSLGN